MVIHWLHRRAHRMAAGPSVAACTLASLLTRAHACCRRCVLRNAALTSMSGCGHTRTWATLTLGKQNQRCHRSPERAPQPNITMASRKTLLAPHASLPRMSYCVTWSVYGPGCRYGKASRSFILVCFVAWNCPQSTHPHHSQFTFTEGCMRCPFL